MVVSLGDAEGVLDGVALGEPLGLGETDGLADGVDVGPSASAGVPRKDTVKATAMSSGKRYRCAYKVHKGDCPTTLRDRTQVP